jgi:hypothetical protein
VEIRGASEKPVSAVPLINNRPRPTYIHIKHIACARTYNRDRSACYMAAPARGFIVGYRRGGPSRLTYFRIIITYIIIASYRIVSHIAGVLVVSADGGPTLKQNILKSSAR